MRSICKPQCGWLAVALAVLALTSAPAQAIQCKTSGKSWRLIDGRKCWHDSRRQVPKSQLHWGPSKAFVRQQQRGVEWRLQNCCYPLPGEL